MYTLIITELNELITMAQMIAFILFSSVGLLFTLLVKRNMKKSKLKTLLLINGLSTFEFMLFAILRNLLYAVTEIVSVSIMNSLLDILRGFFFIVNVICCPILFLVSAILAIIEYRKSRKI